MKNMVTIIAAMGIMLSSAPVNAFCAADTAAASVTAEADTNDIKAFAGKWAHQVSKGNTTVDMSAKNIGTMEINADASYKYTDAEGKTFTGTVKLGSENIGGTEFTVLSFYEGALLRFIASYSESRPDVLSLGNGGLAQFAREAAVTADIKELSGKWTHQISSGNDTVDKGAKNIGAVEINADASYKYTDAEGRTSTGTVKLGSENIGGTELTVLSFYEGAELKFTASYSESRPDVLSLGNGGLAQFARDTALSVPVAYSLGDINNDNAINAVDASKVLSYYAMTSTNKEGGFTDAQKKAADVNGDGYVNSVDASNILACYAYNSTSNSKVLSFEEYRTASTKA